MCGWVKLVLAENRGQGELEIVGFWLSSLDGCAAPAVHYISFFLEGFVYSQEEILTDRASLHHLPLSPDECLANSKL